ncbi:MAG: 4Fe-4S binding protein [Candidatus Bathyarchaeota archaeon]|nr:MAG: 4Fe-4S binding protein [Candidatus Bathyarchaeota archaeon]
MLERLLLLIKGASLLTLGPIVVFGHYGLSVVGGLFGCPYSIPFILCPVCPVPCTFNLIRPWIFGGVIAASLVVGRVFCGMICPIGIVSELASKIPMKKLQVPSLHSLLAYLKYSAVVLLLYLMSEAAVILMGLPVEGLWSLMITYQREVAIAIIAVTLGSLIISTIIYRPLCMYLCPVGTLLSVSNRFSFLTLRRHPEECEECESCIGSCPMSLKGSHDSTGCLRCLSCYATCENNALRLDVRKPRKD